MPILLPLVLLLLIHPTAGQTVQDVEYARIGAESLRLDMHLPTGEGKRRPTIVGIHGGGWRGGDKRHIRGLSAFVRAGFVVASINYRLTAEARYPAAINDCQTAVRWIRAHAGNYGIDPDRIGVLGGSAGGHLALMVGMLNDDPNQDISSRVRAVCAWFGPADFRDGPAGDKAFAQFIGATFEENPKAYREASPATHVSNNSPPTLLIHGANDRVVPIRHSQTMHAALRAAGVESTLVVVRNAGHGFRGQSIRPSFPAILAKTVSFFKKQLQEPPSNRRRDKESGNLQN